MDIPRYELSSNSNKKPVTNLPPKDGIYSEIDHFKEIISATKEEF